MATNIFVDWSDGLEGRVFDNHSRNGGQGICQQKLPGDGGGMLVAGFGKTGV